MEKQAAFEKIAQVKFKMALEHAYRAGMVDGMARKEAQAREPGKEKPELLAEQVSPHMPMRPLWDWNRRTGAYLKDKAEGAAGWGADQASNIGSLVSQGGAQMGREAYGGASRGVRGAAGLLGGLFGRAPATQVATTVPGKR